MSDIQHIETQEKRHLRYIKEVVNQQLRNNSRWTFQHSIRTDGWIESMHESALEKYQDKKKWDTRKMGEGSLQYFS